MSKQVTPVHGEPLRFWVESSDSDNPHFVDLLEYSGNGECSCPHFRIRCQRNYRDNEYRIVNHGFPNATRCKHINTAMLYMANTVIKGVLDELKQSD